MIKHIKIATFLLLRTQTDIDQTGITNSLSIMWKSTVFLKKQVKSKYVYFFSFESWVLKSNKIERIWI